MSRGEAIVGIRPAFASSRAAVSLLLLAGLVLAGPQCALCLASPPEPRDSPVYGYGDKPRESGGFHGALSLQGFTGVLNTPNAHVTEEGWFYALYSNQIESKWRQEVSFQDNYLFSIGFFNFIELGGRFFEAPGAGRDLSANVKISTAPLTSHNPLMPVLALGVQDVGGGAALLQTRYLVVSEDLGPLRLSLGYGQGPDRMKGAFGGAELKVHDYLYLLGDYDTEEKNVGARAVLPQFWKVPVSFTATAKTSLSHKPGNFDIAVGVSLPLDFRMKKEQRGFSSATRPLSLPTEPRTAPTRKASALPGQSSLQALRDALVREGFVNVRVGSADRTLVVEYENVTYNHNELDALGVVAGLACSEVPESFDTLSVVVKRRDIPMATVSVPFAAVREFMNGTADAAILGDSMSFDYDTSVAQSASFIDGEENPGAFNTSIMLAPFVTTFIGTEVGAFDYYLSLKPELNTLLWKGAAATARWNVPLGWSENLENGRQFSDSRQPAQMDRLMLFQAAKPFSTVTVNIGAGMIVADRYGTLNEAVWTPGEGGHRFRVAQAWSEESDTHREYDVYLGSYRYLYSPFDLSIEATAGKFWAQDKGASLEVKRYFEDTSVTFYLKGSKGEDRKSWRSVGLQLTFPLTPRRDMKPVAKLQLRGSDEWAYAQESTLKNNNVNNATRGSLNYLAPYPLAINPQSTQALYRSMYNKDRLNGPYLRRHLERLREGWLIYLRQEGLGRNGAVKKL